jgi:hypothetical protein
MKRCRLVPLSLPPPRRVTTKAKTKHKSTESLARTQYSLLSSHHSHSSFIPNLRNSFTSDTRQYEQLDRGGLQLDTRSLVRYRRCFWCWIWCRDGVNLNPTGTDGNFVDSRRDGHGSVE